MRRPLRETLRDIDKTPPKCLVKNSKLDESACKPDSVTPCGAGDHPSATTVSGGLPRTLTRPACDLPGSSGGPPSIASADARGRPLGLAPGGVCRATTVTGRAVVSYTRHFTLTRTLSPDGAGFRAVCFLWHFPAGHPGWALPTTVPCGARTFLGVLTYHAAAWPTHSLRIVYRLARGGIHGVVSRAGQFIALLLTGLSLAGGQSSRTTMAS